MIRIRDISLPPEHDPNQLVYEAAQQLKISPAKIKEIFIVRRSVDARKKPEIWYVYVVDVKVDNENAVLKKVGADIDLSNYYTKAEIDSALDNIDIPETAIATWDATQEQNGTITAWILDEDNNGLYELYIGTPTGAISLPANSNWFFSYYNNVKNIDTTHLDTSKVTKLVKISNWNHYME